MNYIKKKLRLYWPFTRGSIQVMMSYRFNIFMFVIGDLLRTFVIYYLWKAVYMNSGNAVLNGFTIDDMVVYIFISSITAGTIENHVDYHIGNEVRDGSIAMNLIKPINYHVRMLFGSFGGLIYGSLLVSVPLWIGLISVRYFSIRELPPDFSTIGAYLLSLAMGFLIMFLFNFCFGLLAFFVTNLWGVSNLKGAVIMFLSGQLIPIAFFPDWLQSVLKFVPFGSMNYIPVMIYLKKITGSGVLQALGIQFFWLCFMLAVSVWIWKKATRRLTIQGG